MCKKEKRSSIWKKKTSQNQKTNVIMCHTCSHLIFWFIHVVLSDREFLKYNFFVAFEKIIFKNAQFIMKYLSHIVFLTYKWYKFMKNICKFDHIPIEKKWYRSECFKNLKYHQTTALYSEKLMRIKRSINEHTILKLKKPWNFCNNCDIFHFFLFWLWTVECSSKHHFFWWLFDLNLKKNVFKGAIKEIQERLNIVKKPRCVIEALTPASQYSTWINWMT